MRTNPGTVTGFGYSFKFTGMSTIQGTVGNDTFEPGPSNVTVDGHGGQDGLSYANPTGPQPTGAVVVNLSTLTYTIPTGLPNAGTTVPPCTATGGFGGTVTMTNLQHLQRHRHQQLQ